jgi:hypothetical protein
MVQKSAVSLKKTGKKFIEIVSLNDLAHVSKPASKQEIPQSFIFSVVIKTILKHLYLLEKLQTRTSVS